MVERGQWRSLGPTRQLDGLVHRMRQIAAQSTAVLPARLSMPKRNRTAVFRPRFRGVSDPLNQE